VDTLRAGDYFVTSGEVLFRNWNIEGSGAKRTYAAEAEWTFPPEFAELVWSDGNTVERQVIDMKAMRRSAATSFAYPSTCPERSGCGSPSGTPPETAHSPSLYTSSNVPLRGVDGRHRVVQDLGMVNSTLPAAARKGMFVSARRVPRGSPTCLSSPPTCCEEEVTRSNRR